MVPLTSLIRFARCCNKYWLIAALLGAVSCLGSQEDALTDPEEVTDLQVLFIGNSLTFWNDLPNVLAALIDSADAVATVINSVTVGGYRLQDHWNHKTARDAIALGGWDVIVLQQGSSASDEDRASLLQYTELFAADAEAIGARIAMYMVWPSINRLADFDRVCESYTMAAQEVGGLLFPVGEAWRIAWQREPDLELYDADGGHPSRVATYLAALVMFQQLTGRTPIGLPRQVALRDGALVGATDSVAAMLQEVAAEANRLYALP
jgi:hypothetical protein